MSSSHAESSKGLGSKTKLAIAGGAGLALGHSGIVGPAIISTVAAVKGGVATLSVTNPVLLGAAAIAGTGYIGKKIVWDRVVMPMARKAKSLVGDSHGHGGGHH